MSPVIVLVTGGAGFIGSHTCVELLEDGYEVVVIDSLVNAQQESLRRVKEITGKDLIFHQGSINDQEFLEDVFSSHKIQLVIHFAALKAVGESVTASLTYYDNNVSGTITLLKVMEKFNVKQIVFSSSATVYGNEYQIPIKETFQVHPTNPYGFSKMFIEQILNDLFTSQPEWRIIILRYFNPVGAHVSGRIGEDPNGRPNNLFPFITQVAIGKIAQLQIFGDDYDTPDGTGIRDYIHITDLARGHLAAMRDLFRNGGRCDTYNLGTGKGYSVLEILRAMEKTIARKIPHTITERRSGDVNMLLSDPTKAQRELGWRAEKNLDEMCQDTWRWQTLNPNGYNHTNKSLL